MSDANEIRFSGTIERLKSVNTKTGTTMVTLLLKVGQDRFKVVAFNNALSASSLNHLFVFDTQKESRFLNEETGFFCHFKRY